ncbi:MAG: DNA polymerase III subunit gamma/tau, partial [Rhizobiaceae bacterium]|nr:DNA polymerase III subunit gamma/tau [Rhizobiaceae bacterium]
RFDLRRVDAGLLVEHLRAISAREEIGVEDAALAMVARAAEGSVRDSLSILDQAIAHGEGKVTAEAVRAMLGLADRTRVVDLFEQLMKGDVAAALNELRAQYDTGADPAAILVDLAEFNHLVTRMRFVPSAAADATLSEEERRRGLEFSRTLPVRVLSRTWQMLTKGIPEVQSSNRPVSAAEMVLIRIAHAADLPTLDEALKALEGGAEFPSASSARAPSAGGASPAGGGASAVSAQRQAAMPGGGAAMRLVEPLANPAQAAQRTQTAPAPEPEAVAIATLDDIAALADARRDIAFKVIFKRCVRLVRLEPGRLEVALTDDAPKTLLGDLSSRLQAWTGRRWVVSLSRDEGGQTLAQAEESRRESVLNDARNVPAVAAILARFPGARIIDVRIPDAVQAEAAGKELEPAAAGEPAADDDDTI